MKKFLTLLSLVAVISTSATDNKRQNRVKKEDRKKSQQKDFCGLENNENKSTKNVILHTSYKNAQNAARLQQISQYAKAVRRENLRNKKN